MPAYMCRLVMACRFHSESCTRTHTISGMNDEGPTLSVTLDRRDTTEEEKLQFEQLEQFIHQLQSIKGAVPKYTRTGRKSDTLLITFKNTGALWRLTGRRTSHLLAV